MKETIILYYDTQCPFCNKYAQLVKLKDKFKIELKDARNHMIEISNLAKGIDINDGFIVVHKNKFYQGVKALRFLNNAVEKSTLLGKLHFLFKYDNFFSNLLYKMFFVSRKIILFIFRRNSKI